MDAELFEAPFNLAGEAQSSELASEGLARAKAEADAIARKAQFVMGWRMGSYSREHGYLHCDITRRQVEAKYPEWTVEQVDRYLNGYDDGWNGDTFRFHH